MDFTLSKYNMIIEAGLETGYNLGTVKQLFDNQLEARFIVLRHDVDRKAENALAMARAEAERGVSASYYFRSVKASFVPDIICEIRDMGHEIGYHYEDWHTAKYNPEKALDLFKEHLAELGELAPVSTICMHGSPLSKENNMAIWDHWNYRDHGVEDCILSYDYSGHAFFTDSGRTFGVSGANLRDELGNADIYTDVRSTEDLVKFIHDRRTDKIMVSCHPERWSDQKVDWSLQFTKDKLANTIKRGLRLVKSITP